MVAQTKNPYEPNWNSPKMHPTAQWFREAKCGIYTHWGSTVCQPKVRMLPGIPTTEVGLEVG